MTQTITKRIVFFDVDGVLIQGYHAKPELRKCWDENIEIDLKINRNHLQENFISGVFIQEIIHGKKDLKSAISDYLLSINSAVDADKLIEYWLAKDSNINHLLFEKIKILKESGKVKLLIATNQEHNRADYLMNQLGFNEYFDNIFYAAKIGFAKPDRKYFENVMTHIGSVSYPPIFFDDSQVVVDAANDYGWEAYQFDSAEDLNKSDFIRSLLSL